MCYKAGFIYMVTKWAEVWRRNGSFVDEMGILVTKWLGDEMVW